MGDKLHNKSLLILVQKIPEQQNDISFPPIFHNNEFVTNLKKAKPFHSFLQSSVLWSIIIANSQQSLVIWLNLGNVIFTTEEMYNIMIQISICMLIFWGNLICKLLDIIYKEYLSFVLFLLECKKGNIVPVHKESYKFVTSTSRL